MKTRGNGGQVITDTSSPEYRKQAENRLNTTEARRQRGLEHEKLLAEQREKAKLEKEEQRSQVSDLSAEQALLKAKIEEQTAKLEKAKQDQLEQTNTERSHRFTSNADSVRDLIINEIIKLSKTDGSNLESAREKVSETLAKLNSAPDSLSFDPMHAGTIMPESFIKEKLSLEGLTLTKDESLLLTKLILSINGIKHKEDQDGGLSDINSPKTNLFIPKTNLNYKEAIVLNAGTGKADSYDALLSTDLTAEQAEGLMRYLLLTKGIEFTERRNAAGLTEFHFPKPLEKDVSLRDKTLVHGVLGGSINVPSTGELQSVIIPSTDDLQSTDQQKQAKSRNDLLKVLVPLIIGGVGGAGLGGSLVSFLPNDQKLPEPTGSAPTGSLQKAKSQELNELKLKYPSDYRIETPTNTYIERDAGENVSQALLKVYPGYHQLERMYRQQIEQTILNERNIKNDTQGYPHSNEVIIDLPPYIMVPSVKDMHQKIKDLDLIITKPGQSLSLEQLYKILTETKKNQSPNRTEQ
jgi:hypothetical protein